MAHRPQPRRTSMEDFLEDDEQFAARLKRLADMTPEEKRAYGKRLDAREKDMAKRSREANGLHALCERLRREPSCDPEE